MCLVIGDLMQKLLNVKTKIAVSCLVFAILATGAFTAAGSAAPTGAKISSTTIRSTLSNYKIKLSKKSAKRGTVTFKITNKRGYHDLCFRGKGIKKCSKKINKGKMTFKIKFRKKGTYTAYCSVGNHEKLGMKTKFKVR